MIQNFIKVSFRHFAKNKLYTLINVSGLSIGLACFILLSLYVRYEQSYDESYPDNELIYQVSLTLDQQLQMDMLTPPAGPLIAETIPEVESFARLGYRENLPVLTNGNRFMMPKVYFTDNEVFNYFDIQFLSSNERKFKLDKNEIVISKTEAEKLFGSIENAIGKSFEIIDYEEFIVKDVFEDLPENTHLSLDYIIALEHIKDLLYFKRRQFTVDLNEWDIGALLTYVKVNKTVADVDSLESKIKDAFQPHRKAKDVKLVRLDEIYFSDFNNGHFKAKGEKKYSSLYMAIGLLVLLVAVVNYTNLSTAKFSKRAKEVGVRKVIGGHRSQLIWQFLTESIALTVLSLVLAICLAESVIPYFNSFTGKSISINYSAPSTYLVFIGLSLSIGLLAGIYPSLFLSRFSPKLSLNGKGRNRGVFRQVLVGFQFAACLALMVVTGVVHNQHKHMRAVDLGFNQDQVIRVPLKDDRIKKSYSSFRNELLKSQQLVDVKGVSTNLFGEESIISTNIEGWDRDKRMSMTFAMVEVGFFSLMEIEKSEGQFFSELDNKEARGALTVNEALVAAAGWEEPIGKGLMDANVTSVVRDFIFGSAKDEISPLAIFELKGNRENSAYFEEAFMRVSGDIPSVIAHIESIYDKFSLDYPFEYKFVDDDFAAKYETENRLSQSFSVLSLLALFIAGLGIMGLSIFVAETRIKEIGIRKVLGAAVNQIVWLLNGGTTALILGTAVITLPVVYFLMQKWLQEFALKIELGWAYFIVPLLLLLISVWAIQFYQSFKSAKANPVDALRME